MDASESKPKKKLPKRGFGASYAIVIIRNPQNSMGNNSQEDLVKPGDLETLGPKSWVNLNRNPMILFIIRNPQNSIGNY